ncbi:MAG: 4-hydroxythreonine-4-phosphate dehydrogenase PdxA [Wenzhouxiangellaceae bacterium]
MTAEANLQPLTADRWLALTAGEPAGVGPELCVRLALQPLPATPLAIADRALLQRAAARLGEELQLISVDRNALPLPQAHQPGVLHVCEQALPRQETPGSPHPDNALYVLDCLSLAVALCAERRCAALVTAPVHKGVINQAGIAFTGHTEYLATACGSNQVLMMLADRQLRVALCTTHLPLSEVPRHITVERVQTQLRILERSLRRQFNIRQPRITVLGLNPHAGEGGHLGQEELTVIQPAMMALATQGMQLRGPIPADTAFNPPALAQCDAILAMYHDQGLPPLKALSFGRVVNITLGLPLIRTSVDHGTALDIAGRNQADVSSLRHAFEQAATMAAAAAAAS